MAFTVTATMSGAAADEHIYLQLVVLTGATETGGAATQGIAASGTTVGGNLTPNFTHGLPCFAITADNPGIVFTPLTNNTLLSSAADSDDWDYGLGYYSGAVTAATPVTFGGTCNQTDYATWSCYEIQPSGGSSPAVDASSPALASGTGAGVKTCTTASFTPPNSSVLVAEVCGGGTGVSGTLSIAITDTSGLSLTWTTRSTNNPVASQNTYVGTATMPSGVTTGPPLYPQMLAAVSVTGGRSGWQGAAHSR